MTEDELEAIRERKREQLLESDATGGSEAKGSETGENETEANGTGGGQTGENEIGESRTGRGVTAPDEPIHVGSVEEFSTVTTQHDVVLVDFYADWCGPCNMLEPSVAAIAEKTDAAVAKVDIDEHQGLAAQYGVRSVPTLLLFADGKQVKQIVGAQSEAKLTSLVERYA